MARSSGGVLGRLTGAVAATKRAYAKCFLRDGELTPEALRVIKDLIQHAERVQKESTGDVPTDIAIEKGRNDQVKRIAYWCGIPEGLLLTRAARQEQTEVD